MTTLRHVERYFQLAWEETRTSVCVARKSLYGQRTCRRFNALSIELVVVNRRLSMGATQEPIVLPLFVKYVSQQLSSKPACSLHLFN
jgi:hypothetical protein